MNISDIIQEFIIKSMGDDGIIDISRNELAEFFTCAPSQINYVLETRFTVDKGYLIESKRGGGGFIRITKKDLSKDGYVNSLILESIGDELKYQRATSILDRLVKEKIITKREKDIISAAILDSAIASPFAIKDKLRASIFKSIMLSILEVKK